MLEQKPGRKLESSSVAANKGAVGILFGGSSEQDSEPPEVLPLGMIPQGFARIRIMKHAKFRILFLQRHFEYQ